ncbi:MAG: hypothetical protein IT381_16455 [Deltaproteobacteria bacterium]|nr:hypothetical protein [Deltaproteobacteria bacterium]
MRSPIYWHPLLYRLTLRALYGDALSARFDAVLPLIAAAGGDSLLDVCAGDGAIRHRLPAGMRYVPLDGNLSFVEALRDAGLPAVWLDVRSDPLPRADVVLMMGSLYHFVPEQRWIVEKLRAAAKKRLIIVEPHVNWSAKGGVLGKIAQWASDPGIERSHLGRLGQDDLQALVDTTHPTAVQRLEREWVIVWD